MTDEEARSWLRQWQYKHGYMPDAAPTTPTTLTTPTTTCVIFGIQARRHGWTPMCAACSKCELPVAQWLFDVGRQTENKTENVMAAMFQSLNALQGRAHVQYNPCGCCPQRTPMCWAMSYNPSRSLGTKRRESRHEMGASVQRMVRWLVRKGAWQSRDVDGVRRDVGFMYPNGQEVARDMIYRRQLARFQSLLVWAREVLASGTTFFSTFLLGTLVSYDETHGQRTGSPHLWKLNSPRGHLKRKIAAYVGVVEAVEEFRNVREAAAVMEAVLAAETRWRLRPEHIGLGPNWGCALQ